jgi:SAM-dependent methyltransferase
MSGVREILDSPRLYELWSRLVGGERGRNTLVREHVHPKPNARLLDLGCGPGELLTYLDDVRYVGVDTSTDYIERARAQFGERGEFRVGDATRLDADLRGFDVVVAFGVLHHLDDAEAGELLRGAASALGPGGRFVSVDPAIVRGQGRAERLFVNGDRGADVRTPDAYRRLAERAFSEVRTTVRSDLLRIPYTHCVLECS